MSVKFNRRHNFQAFLALFSLSSPRSRLTWWAFLTGLIYIVPFRWLENLSLYKLIGWDWAPSIGLTRAYWLILHGYFDAAIALNSLILVVLIVGLPLLILDVLNMYRSTVHVR